MNQALPRVEFTTNQTTPIAVAAAVAAAAMDEHLETSWCPVCDKLIQPQRFTVQLDADGQPVSREPQAQSIPTPSGSARNAAAAARGKRPARTATGAHGLVHGTGRVKPGGGLRRQSDDPLPLPLPAVRTTRSALMLPPPPPPSPESLRPATFPPKVRTLISQAQTPLYCSDRCRLIDAQRRACVHTSGVAIGTARTQYTPSALHESPVSYDNMLHPPQPSTRRASDSSNGTDVSSLFDHAPARGSLPDLDEDEIPHIKSPKKPVDLLANDTTAKIREALFDWRTKQPKAPYGERQERVAPGWRAGETEWRKIVYGDFSPKPRPQMPPREPSPPPALPPPLPVDPAHLSPFDRLPTLASMSAPDPHAAQRELLSKMKFARTPSTVSCSASTLTRSRSNASASSIASPPASKTAFSFRSQSSNERSRDSHDEDSPSDSEEEFIQAHIKRASVPSAKRGRLDPLSRALEDKQREKLKEEFAAAHLAQLERDCDEARELRERGVKPQSLQERIVLQGPIMGRRAAGMSQASAAPQHSWSYEDLPRHIPLYPMPGVHKPRIEKQVQRVQDECTGEIKDVEVDVDVSEPLKRLFLFGGTSSSAPRRHSALSFSP